MLLKLFNSNRIGVLVIIVLLPVLYWMPDLWMGEPLHASVHAGTLPGEYIQHLNQDYRIFSRFAAIVVILVNAFLLVLLNRIHIFIPVKTQLPAFFYILLAACINPVHQLTGALLASFLLIIVLYRVTTTYKSDSISYNFLDAGFLIALASFLYFPAIFFFVLLLAGLVLLRTFNWREWMYAIVGFGLPYLFLFSGFYLADLPVSDFFPGLAEIFSRNRQTFSLIQLICWAFTTGMLIYASSFMIITMDNMKIHGRKIFMFFLWLFLISVGIYVALPGSGTEIVSFAAIPVSFLLSHFFSKCDRNWINELLFTLFLIQLILLRIL